MQEDKLRAALEDWEHEKPHPTTEAERLLRERLRVALASSPAPAGLGEQAVAAIVEWSRRYNGQFGYDEQHAFVRERFDPIARAATRPAYNLQDHANREGVPVGDLRPTSSLCGKPLNPARCNRTVRHDGKCTRTFGSGLEHD